MLFINIRYRDWQNQRVYFKGEIGLSSLQLAFSYFGMGNVMTSSWLHQPE